MDCAKYSLAAIAMDTTNLDALKAAFNRDDARAVRAFLEANPDFKQRINDPVAAFGSPAIHGAKSREMLDVLLEAGANINARSEWWAGGFGLLDSAEPELAEYAISRGAKLDPHSAARLGKIQELRELLGKKPSLVHDRGGDGQMPLHFASTIEIAELLLEKGADIDARDIDHESTAAQWMIGSRQEIARFLVERGTHTDLLMATALGDLPLIKKILDDDPEAIRLRVSDEFFPMINPKAGGTIYQWELGWYVSAHQVARRFGHEEALELLMKRSPADVKLVNACWLGDEETALPFSAMLRARAGGRGVGKSPPKNAPELGPIEARQLAHAARNNDLPALRLMLKAGLPVGARSQHGGTALHWAAWHGNLPMVKAILLAGADVRDAQNDYEGTPLDWAIHASEHGWDPMGGDYPGTTRALVAAGAPRPEKIGGSEAVRKVLEGAGFA